MLQPTGLAVLARLCLSERALACGRRIDRLHGVSDGRTVLDVAYASLGRAHLFGIGIHRANLFALLHQAAAERGVEVATAAEVVRSLTSAEGRRLVFASGETSEAFDLVVDASGTGSRLAGAGGEHLPYGALWASVDWVDGAGLACDALQQRYRAAHTMAGVMPMGTGEGTQERATLFWSLRADRYETWQAAGLDCWKQSVRVLWPETEALLAQIRDPGQLTFARYAQRTMRRPAGDRLIHIGDAWHSASPQLGQGANMALLDAWSLAIAVERSASLREALAAAVAQRSAHVALYQALTAVFTPVYQSDGSVLPWLRDRLIAPLSRLRWMNRLQAAMVSGMVGWPLNPLGLEVD